MMNGDESYDPLRGVTAAQGYQRAPLELGDVVGSAGSRAELSGAFPVLLLEHT